MTIYPIHPACAKWPGLSPTGFKELVADIKAKGLLEPIWLTEAGEILEGKLRYNACALAGVEPRFEIYHGDDPIGFTISHNKLRRHMSAAQLAFIGEELSTLQPGTNQYKNKVDHFSKRTTFEPSSQKKIAEQLGVSTASLGAARALKLHGEPNVIELAKTGQVGLQNAANYARHTSRDEQHKVDIKTVKNLGNRLRTPRKNKKILEIGFSLEQWQELNEKLRPLIKRLRVQSKKHIVEFSPFELECIAFEMDKLLESWANAATDVPLKASN